MWTDRQIIAALNRASAVVERIHDALRPIGPRLSDLLRDTATSDAQQPERPNNIGANQMSHAAITDALTHLLVAAGVSPLYAALVLTLGWGAAWEGWQYRRAVASGGSRTRTLRDWVADAAAYLSGAAMGQAQLSGDFWPILWTTGTATLQAAVSAGVFGRTPEEAKK